MNIFVKALCFTGGANLDVLRKCATEKNDFTAAGIGIINVTLISAAAMTLTMRDVLDGRPFLSLLIALFYGFVVFTSYWGALSALRRAAKHPMLIKVFGAAAITLYVLAAGNAINRYVLKNAFSFSASFQEYCRFAFVVMLVMVIYAVPLVIRLLMNSSAYEEERTRIERNFLTQKEADITAYREKYKEYALTFNDTGIRMDLIKQLSEISKEYHGIVEKTQKETFEFLNKLAKLNGADNTLLNECKTKAEEEFKMTLDKMSKVFSGI